MKVLALTRYGREGASSRVRFLEYVPALETAGIHVQVRALWGRDYLERFYADGTRSIARTAAAYARRAVTLMGTLTRKVDVVWLEAELFPYLPGLVEGALPVPLVVDYDDAVWEKYARVPVLRAKIDRVMRAATTVIAANEVIAMHAREAGARRVEVIPTVVDLARYPLVEPPPAPPLRVGWIGTPHTVRYLDLIGDALAEVSRVVDLELVVIGAAWRKQGVHVTCLPWSEGTEARDLSACHVGIMPLPDEPWARGKSGYKLIQAMACGRPVIASPVGANMDIVTPDVGWLARGLDEWAAALRSASDGASRARRGSAARARVEARYSLQCAAPAVRDALRAARA